MARSGMRAGVGSTYGWAISPPRRSLSLASTLPFQGRVKDELRPNTRELRAGADRA
jgi:hypothetical protein